jgi:hypothetical protein
MRLGIFGLAIGILVAPPAAAAALGGVSMPDQVRVGGKELVLNGLGLREATWLKVDVYVAGLYLERKSGDPQVILGSGEAKRIALEFVRKVKRKSITDAWDEGFDKNAGGQGEALNERVDRLNAAMIDFKPGDTMSFTFLPGTGVELMVSGESKGTIEGDDFARVLLSIWLGPEPPNPGLKTRLLGVSGRETDPQSP